MHLVAPVVVEFYGGGGCSLPGATLLPLSLLEFELAFSVVEVRRKGDDGVVVVVHIIWSNETHLHLIAPVVVAGI